MIKLRRFGEGDIERLIKWIPDDRFLLQWAGPKYKFPLDAEQLLATLKATEGPYPHHLMFAAVCQTSGEVIGHIELMGIDYEKSSAHLGRVLIGNPEHRSKGYGKEMVRETIRFAFDTLNLSTISLCVFDFNIEAITAYEAVGFVEFDRKPNARRYKNEHWTLVFMHCLRQK